MAEPGQAGSASAALKAQEQGGALILYLSGELDVTTADQIRSAIDAAVGGDTERLIIDLADLQFMDSSGIALIVSVAQRVREAQVRNPSAIVRRLIELTGLEEALHITPLEVLEVPMAGPSSTRYPRPPAASAAATPTAERTIHPERQIRPAV